MLPVWFLTSRSPDWFAGRGRPPQAAVLGAGLEFVEKLLPTNLNSTDTMERDASMLLLLDPRPALLYRWSGWLLVLAGCRVGPQGVDDLPAVAGVHELEVLDVDGRANGRVRDRAVQVLNLDLPTTPLDPDNRPGQLRDCGGVCQPVHHL
jgi:hypothetical protein